MKKLICAIIALLLIVSLFVITYFGESNTEVEVEAEYSQEFSGTTLNVFNWGEYISDGAEGMLDVIGAFEKLTGIKVNYTTYESNEAMYAKLKSESVAYDIVIPSDYMIQRMAKEGMLKEIDYSKITNYKYILDDYKGQYYDPLNKYTVPYSVGMVGLIYNTEIVKETPTGWDIMWDEKYKGQILNFNNSRDAFAVAQFSLGINVNTTNKSEWDLAANKLIEQNPLLQGRVMDEVFNKMEAGNAAIAPYYAGDFLTMKEVNDSLEFIYPNEGTNIFVDAMCIPSCSQNYEAALMFINFMLEPEVALANAEFTWYATPNSAVLENEDYELYNNEYLYPDYEIKTEYYYDLDNETRTYFEKLWEKVIIN